MSIKDNSEDMSEGQLEIVNTHDELLERINTSRLEIKQLFQQIDKVKQRIQDSSLVDCSKQIPPIPNNSLNLKCLQILKGHNNKVQDLRWSSDSKSILSCSQDGFLIIWDPVTGMKLNAIPLDSQWVLTCAYSPNMKMIASAGLTNNCTIYSIPDNPEEALMQNISSVFKGHVCGITCVEFVNNEKVLTGSGDMTCALWDISKNRRIANYKDHYGDILCMDIDASFRNVFCSGASDGYARIWDMRINENSSQQSFFVSNSDITSVKFLRDDYSFITGSDDGIIRMYDLRTDCELSIYSMESSIDEFNTNIKDKTFLETDSDLPHSPSYFQTYPLSQPSSLSQHNSLSDMNSVLDNCGVTSLDFSRSSRLMYSCYAEQGCYIWDLLKGVIVGKLEGHTNRVIKAACSPNGLGVVTGSWDTTMRVYTPSYV